MSFLNGRVSPEPLSLSSQEETELIDSSNDKKDMNNFNNNEGTETSITNDCNAKEYQEELDGIPEEQICNTSNPFENGKTSRPGSQCPKLLSWNAEEASRQIPKSYHTCDRVILLAVCVMSAASIVLTMLVVFGIVAPLNCACSAGKTGSDASTPGADYTELSKNLQDLKQNMSSLKETSDNITAIWQAIQLQTIRQEMKQLEQKENITAIWKAIQLQTNRQELEQLEQKINNISKMAGSIGPPGPNGSQGPAGPAGSVGPPGPKGAGNFSSCQYQTVNGTTTGGGDDSDAKIDEPIGSIIMAATCSTNYAQEYNLKSKVISQKRRYICNCKGPSVKFKPLLGESNTCYLHYWLCSKT